MYTALVLLGIVLGLAATRFGPPSAVPPAVARRAQLGGLIGAVMGAHLFELPADLFGWTAPIAGHAGAPLFGRTVIGGILGGWAGVEVGKASLGYRGATGDRFAAPLAIALACGRIGCVLTGCCPGAPLPEGSAWASLSSVHHDPPRFPATLLEAYFHAAMAVVLLVLARQRLLEGRHFALYVTLIAVVRFALERVRDNPPILLGLTYYQWLTVPLFALGVATFVARSRSAAAREATNAAS